MSGVKLSAHLLGQVQTGSLLPRVNAAADMATFLQTANTRLDALYLVGEKQVLEGQRLSGVIPQGGAQAQSLFGKGGTGKEHKSVATQVAFATPAQIAQFKTELQTLAATATLDQLKTRFFEMVDSVRIPLTIWAETEPKAWEALGSGRGTFAASLRVDPLTGNISLSQAEPEGYTNVVKIPRRTLDLGISDNSQPVNTVEMVKIGDAVMTVDAARQAWAINNPLAGEAQWQAVLATLPKA